MTILQSKQGLSDGIGITDIAIIDKLHVANAPSHEDTCDTAAQGTSPNDEYFGLLQ